MNSIRDDPIIACMERTGYPPWMQGRSYDEWDEDEWEEGEDGDVYYGNETPSF